LKLLNFSCGSCGACGIRDKTSPHFVFCQHVAAVATFQFGRDAAYFPFIKFYLQVRKNCVISIKKVQCGDCGICVSYSSHGIINPLLWSMRGFATFIQFIRRLLWARFGK
jgi:hypothetical protein